MSKLRFLWFFFRLIQWLLYLPIYGILWLLKFPLAPIAVLCFCTKDGKNLKGLVKYIGTIDNDLGGDSPWLNKIKGNRYSFWNKTKWLWRNGFNYFNFIVLSVEMQDEYYVWFNYQDQRNLWIFKDGSWQWRAKVRIPIWNRYWTPFIGWGLFGPINGKCKFTCTIPRFNKMA